MRPDYWLLIFLFLALRVLDLEELPDEGRVHESINLDNIAEPLTNSSNRVIRSSHIIQVDPQYLQILTYLLILVSKS